METKRYSFLVENNRPDYYKQNKITNKLFKNEETKIVDSQSQENPKDSEAMNIKIMQYDFYQGRLQISSALIKKAMHFFHHNQKNKIIYFFFSLNILIMNNFPQQWQNLPFPNNFYPQQNVSFANNCLFPSVTQGFQQQYFQAPFQLPPFNGLSDALNMISPANLNLDLELEVKKPRVIRRFKPQKKDPVLDTKDEINKWLEQRRIRYPKKDKPIDVKDNGELSILETRLRKKICVLSGSVKRAQVKALQMKELCRSLTQGQRAKKNQSHWEENNGQQIEEEGEKPTQTNLTKEEVKLEISKIQQSLNQMRPKQFYKAKPEGGNGGDDGDAQGVGKGQKKRLKRKLKMLKNCLQTEQEENSKKSIDDHYTEMVKNLKSQKIQMDRQQLLDKSLDYQQNPANFRYKSDTLLTNLLLDQIYQERQYLLQAIRYIVKENFFEEREFEKLSDCDL